MQLHFKMEFLIYFLNWEAKVTCESIMIEDYKINNNS